MRISIIIPAYNEEPSIAQLVSYLIEKGGKQLAEVIVGDGGSSDRTREKAAAAGALVIACPVKGRSRQMNHAASLATGDILYFVHADTFPPAQFVKDILGAVAAGYSLGRYRTRFLSSRRILRLNEWFTALDLFVCMGGDQTLFIVKAFFARLKGFNNEMVLMEEYEFCARARQQGRYTIMKGAALVSARKYDRNSWLQVQCANIRVIQLYKRGASQQTLVDTYKRMLRW